MSAKRKDNKGRNLKANEYQKKDGRYEYRYTQNGVMRSVYSWRLVETDAVPKGKRKTPALRTLEAQILKDLEDDINVSTSQKMTINQMFENVMEARKGHYKRTSWGVYIGTYNRYVRNSIGTMRVKDLTPLQLAMFYNKIQNEHNLSASTMNFLSHIFHLVFTLAEDEKLVRDNPCPKAKKIYMYNNELSTPKKKEALTRAEEQTIMDACKYSSKRTPYLYPMVLIALKTGMRVGELCALQFDDLDLEKGIIYVRHSIVREYYGEKSELHMSSPKSKTSIRMIPMFSVVKETLLELKNKESFESTSPQIDLDGYHNFVFTMNRKFIQPNTFRSNIHRIVKDYNEQLENNLALDSSPIRTKLPNITPHVFRHTFATRLIEFRVPINVVSALLGHSSTNQTESVYVTNLFENTYNVIASLDELLEGKSTANDRVQETQRSARDLSLVDVGNFHGIETNIAEKTASGVRRYNYQTDCPWLRDK